MSDISFTQVRMTEPTVFKMLEASASMEDIVVELVRQKNILFRRVIELESIAPRKFKLPSGQTVVWHCPPELVTDLSPLSL